MGTSIVKFANYDICQDHPHAYGDKQISPDLTNYVTGSSPRVWGQAFTQIAGKEVCGIIPTRMGTRVATMILKECLLDHPHAYGDKTLILVVTIKVLGSSPRVWGQATKSALLAKGDRIIPTRMGTSVIIDRSCSYDEDHPHAYGDKFLQTFYFSMKQGSSPRVWGQDYSETKTAFMYRIIPTRMGTRYPH